jgi:hypothetical protein
LRPPLSLENTIVIDIRHRPEEVDQINAGRVSDERFA